MKSAMKYFKKNNDSTGFTIIELLIATLIFSIVLVVILAAFVQISRLFYKGVNMSNLQNDARTITQNIADDIQFAQNPPTFVPANSSGIGYFCVGLHRYKYHLRYQVGSSTNNDFGILRETVSYAAGCTLSAPGSNPEELLGNGMQLNYINNLTSGCVNGRCKVNVHVIFYGGDPQGLFSTKNSSYSSSPWNAPDAECTGTLTDSQYCATADYDKTVLQRT